MHAGSTLFLDVGTQHDLWPGGLWPLLDEPACDQVRLLCALGCTLDVRAGGICCAHEIEPAGRPTHCVTGTHGAERVEACAARLPVRLFSLESQERPAGRAYTSYLGSGCAVAIATAPSQQAVFAHLIAGVRDAVVFGAGIEFGIAHVIEALLLARVRTHLAIDATGAADAAHAQTLLEGWKRRGVDVLTTATVERLLRRSSGH